jgi:hypothetical protein
MITAEYPIGPEITLKNRVGFPPVFAMNAVTNFRRVYLSLYQACLKQSFQML